MSDTVTHTVRRMPWLIFILIAGLLPVNVYYAFQGEVFNAFVAGWAAADLVSSAIVGRLPFQCREG